MPPGSPSLRLVEIVQSRLLPDLGLRYSPEASCALNSATPAAEWRPMRHEGMGAGLSLGDPKPGHLLLEMLSYTSDMFKECSLMMATRADGLHLARIMVKPRTSYAFPGLGLEIIEIAGRTTLIAADVLPFSGAEGGLTPELTTAVSALALEYNFPPNRDLKAWADDTMSEFCIATTPASEQDVEDYLSYCGALADIYVERAVHQMPLEAGPGREAREAAVTAAQDRFAKGHSQNPAMRRVLQQAFDAELADEFLDTYVHSTSH